MALVGAMGWESVSRAVRAKRAPERWFLLSLVVGIAVAALQLPVAITGHVPFGAAADVGPAMITWTAGPLVGAAGLLAGFAVAMDPVDPRGEPKVARVLGSHVGTLAVTATPLLLGAGGGLSLLLLARGVLIANLSGLVNLMVGAGLVASAWCALVLALTVRAESLARALVTSVAAFVALDVVVRNADFLLPSVISTAPGTNGFALRQLLSLALAILDPTLLGQAFVDAAARPQPGILGDATLFSLALVGWSLIGLGVAWAWMPESLPADPSATTDDATPALPPEPERSPE